MERYGSDKPDIRFAMELVDLAPALAGPDGAPASGSACSTRRWRPAAGSRAIAAPGMGGATRREIDDLTELAKRFGAQGPRPPRGRRGRRAPRARRQVPVAEIQAAIRERPRRGRGRPDPHRRRRGGRHQRRARAAAGRARRRGSGSPTRTSSRTAGSTASRCTSGTPRATRWDATHNPFSGVVPEDEALLTTVVRRASTTGRPTTPPAGPGRCSTTSCSTAGSSAAARSGSGPRDLLARSFNLQGYTLEQMQERFGAMLEAFEYGAPPHGGHRARHRPLGGAVQLPDEHPRGHGLPQDAVGHGPDARGAVGARARAVRGARAAVRGRARPELAERCPAPDPAAGRRRRGGARRPDRPRAAAAGELLGSSDAARRVGHPVRPVRAAPRRGRGDRRRPGGCGAAGDQGLVVEPGHRRRGVGRALVEEGIAIERERERPNLLAGVLPGRGAGARVPRGDRVRPSTRRCGTSTSNPAWRWPRPPGRTASGRGRSTGGATSGRSWPCSTPHSPTTRRRSSSTPTGSQANQGEAPFRDEDLLLLEGPSGELRGSARPSPGGCRTAASRRAARSGRSACGRAARATAMAASSCAGASRHLREVGVETVTLSVNGRNPRALGLYESEGFRRTTTRERWAKPVLAASAKGTP